MPHVQVEGAIFKLLCHSSTGRFSPTGFEPAISFRFKGCMLILLEYRRIIQFSAKKRHCQYSSAPHLVSDSSQHKSRATALAEHGMNSLHCISYCGVCAIWHSLVLILAVLIRRFFRQKKSAVGNHLEHLIEGSENRQYYKSHFYQSSSWFIRRSPRVIE